MKTIFEHLNEATSAKLLFGLTEEKALYIFKKFIGTNQALLITTPGNRGNKVACYIEDVKGSIVTIGIGQKLMPIDISNPSEEEMHIINASLGDLKHRYQNDFK